jgi:hypothetical protein
MFCTLASTTWHEADFFLVFFRKMFTNTPLLVRFQKMDPQLGTVVIGAKIIRLGASQIGAKLRAHVGVDAELAVMWQLSRRQAWRHDGANTIVAELLF